VRASRTSGWLAAEAALASVLVARRVARGERGPALELALGALVDATLRWRGRPLVGAGLAVAIAKSRPALRFPLLAAVAAVHRRSLRAALAHTLAARAALALRQRLDRPQLAPETVVAVVNAHSGSARLARRALRRLHELAPEHPVLVVPPRDVEAALAAGLRRGATLLVAAGGDGTVGTAAHAAATAGVALGIVPTGTGNDTARGLRLPLEPEAAVQVALTGDTALVDLGRAGERTFVHAVSLGVVAQFAAAVRDVRGRWRPVLYPLAAWHVWRRYRGVALELTADGEPLELPQPLVELAIVNTPRLGGRLGISLPSSLTTDGRLTAIAIARTPLAILLEELVTLVRARRPQPQGTLLTRDAKVIAITSPEPTIVAIDGEPSAQTPVTVEAIPAALAVRIPATRRRGQRAHRPVQR
jgi:diacylglycerol kinase family enzyme